MAANTSEGLENDARMVNADGDHVAPGEIAIGVVIGRTSEFFDFFVYAIASVLVFPAYVFPFVDRVQGTVYSFMVFALAFLARPLGSLIFLLIDREYGRGTKLTIALFLLGTSTVALAFLPSYEDVGALSIWLLAAARIAQGIALGGAWDGLASLLALNAPPHRRGWFAMIPQLGAPFGLLIASGLFAYLSHFLSPTDFLAWGWRYPFFVAFAVNIVALFARLRLVVTPEFTRLLGELAPTMAWELTRAEWRTVILGTLAPLASFALFHMVTLFPLSYVTLFTRETATNFLMIEVLGAFVGLVTVAISGLLADRFGRRRLLGVVAVVTALFSVAAPLLLDGGGAGEIIFMVVGFAILGLSFGQSAGVVASGFSRNHRYTGSALTSDLAWLFGAGFAPLVALLITQYFGLWAAGAYLFSGAVATLLALYLNKQLASRLT